MTNDTSAPLADEPSMFDRALMQKDAVQAMESNAIRHQLLTPEAAQEHVDKTWGRVLRQYDFTSAEANGLAELDGLSQQKAPDAETRAAWASEAKAALLATYGPEKVGQALADAKRFISSDPQLHAFARKGWGDHKQLVLLAARKGTEARKAGRLK